MKNFIHWIRGRWLMPTECQVIGALKLDEAGFWHQRFNRLAGCLAMKHQRPLAPPEMPDLLGMGGGGDTRGLLAAAVSAAQPGKTIN